MQTGYFYNGVTSIGSQIELWFSLHINNKNIIFQSYYIINSTITGMAGIQKHRASSAKNKTLHRSRKTKHYTKDHDQIHEDLKKP